MLEIPAEIKEQAKALPIMSEILSEIPDDDIINNLNAMLDEWYDKQDERIKVLLDKL